MERQEYAVKEFKGKFAITLMENEGQPTQVDEETPYIIYDENLEETAKGTTKSNIIILEIPISKVTYVSLKGKIFHIKDENISV